MLTPEMKEELASALATSAIGYAKMSQTDLSLNVSPDVESLTAESKDTLIPREATGPLRKRKLLSISGDDNSAGIASKKHALQNISASVIAMNQEALLPVKCNTEKVVSVNRKARETRLEQNRIAARKSRMRKKTMIHNFHHSIMYYTRANAALQQENETLDKMLKMAQEFVKNNEQGEASSATQEQSTTVIVEAPISDARDTVEQTEVIPVSHAIEENVTPSQPQANARNLSSPSSIQNILEATRILSDTMSGGKGSVPIPEKSLSELCTIAESISKESVPSPATSQSSLPQNQIAQSFSAAAACAANLQVAAANFQAALVASMGNPFFNQFQNQNQPTGSLIQNYPVTMPYVTGPNVFQNQFTPQDASANPNSGVTSAQVANDQTEQQAFNVPVCAENQRGSNESSQSQVGVVV